jgi:hypothetical protein
MLLDHVAETVATRLLSMADVLADRVATRIATLARVHDDYYTQHSNPLGKRQFLEAARRREFPSFPVGRLVLARRSDVNAWIESHERSCADETGCAVDPAAAFAAKGIFARR